MAASADIAVNLTTSTVGIVSVIVFVVACTHPLQHLVEARVHFLCIKIRVLRPQTLIDDLVASGESLRSYIGFKSDQIQTIYFLLCFQKVALNLIYHLYHLLRLLQVLNSHLNVRLNSLRIVETIV